MKLTKILTLSAGLSLLSSYSFAETAIYSQIENVRQAYNTTAVSLADGIDGNGSKITKAIVVSSDSNNDSIVYKTYISKDKTNYYPYNNLTDFGYHASSNLRDNYYWSGRCTYNFISNDTGYLYNVMLGCGSLREGQKTNTTILSNLGSREPAYGNDNRVMYFEAVNQTTGQQSIFKATKGKGSSVRFDFIANKDPNNEMLDLYLPWMFNNLPMNDRMQMFNYGAPLGGKQAMSFYIDQVDLEKLNPVKFDKQLLDTQMSKADDKDLKWSFSGKNFFDNSKGTTKAEYQTAEFNQNLTSTTTITNTNAVGGKRTYTTKVTIVPGTDVTRATEYNYTYTHANAQAEAITKNYIAKSQKVTVDPGCTADVNVYMALGKVVSTYKITADLPANAMAFSKAVKLNNDHTETTYNGSFNLTDALRKASWKPETVILNNDGSVTLTGVTKVSSDDTLFLKVVNEQKCPNKVSTISDIVQQ